MKFLYKLAIIALASAVSVVSANEECFVCTELVNLVEDFVEKNSSIVYVEGELEKVCKFSLEYQATCDSLVTAYGGELVQLLINKEPASTFCSQIDLCTSSAEELTGGVECTICDFALKEVEGFLENSETETEILTQVDKACDLFGGLKSTCVSLANSYIPQLISALENNQNPDTICAEIKACPSSSSERMIKKNF
ncbi:hypothetical protein ACTFIY_007768 [Dictyostelium cf. discoideum]